MSAESVWFKLDSASYVKVQALLAKADISKVDVRGAWGIIAQKYRQRELAILNTAEGRAARSTAPSHRAYLARKRRGGRLNGRGKRAMFGMAPLLAEGKLIDALMKPQTLEMNRHSMTMGVKVRGSNGRFVGDLAHVVPVNRKWGTTKKLTPAERNEWSQVVVRDLIRQIEGP